MHEPQIILPFLAFERESALLRARGGHGRARVHAVPRARRRDTRLAEWVARMTLSYLCSPSEHVDVFDAEQVRSMVDDFVLPGFHEHAGVFEGMK